MDCDSYLGRILEKLLPTHDIVRDYPADGQVLPAYARYEAMNEKYVLSRKATLWKAGEYEHVLFFTVPAQGAPDSFTALAQQLITDYMEPVLARGNEKYPPRDHMRTFLTAVIVSEVSPSETLIRRIRKYRFDKGYQFSFRGFSQGRLVFVDLSAGKVYTSPAANDVAEFFRQIL